MTRLYEHPNFAALVTMAAEHSVLPEQFVEKDYYITEILRVVATEHQGEYIFRGGTSLTKGWSILDRFSDDVDLVLCNPGGNSANATRIKRMFDRVASHPAFTVSPGRSSHEQRSIDLGYQTTVEQRAGVRSAIKLDVATIAGTEPSESRMISSLVAMQAQENSDVDAEDLGSFDLSLLHFRRTFIEKLFAIHGYVERWLEDGEFTNPTVRHYADIYQLSLTPEVTEMLSCGEAAEIKRDYDQLGCKAKRSFYYPPEGLSFKESVALFPTDEVRSFIEPIYTEQCSLLFTGEYPSFDEVLGRMIEIREML